jgi:chromosome segregation ATPase
MTEGIEKLEGELKKKKEELEIALKEFKERTTTKPITGIESVEEKLKAVKEMELEIQQKKEQLERALKEVQEITSGITRLKAKVPEPKEGLIPEIKALQEKLTERKAALEKAIKELEELKEKYTKKFYG